jgi:hypothetical protein
MLHDPTRGHWTAAQCWDSDGQHKSSESLPAVRRARAEWFYLKPDENLSERTKTPQIPGPLDKGACARLVEFTPLFHPPSIVVEPRAAPLGT